MRNYWFFFSLSLAMELVAGKAAAQGARPVGEVLTVDDTTACLHPEIVARDIARWRGRPTLDDRLGVVVRGDATALRFVIRRGDVVVGERVFPAGEVPCAEADATLAAAIASAIDAAEREPPSVPDRAPPALDAVEPAPLAVASPPPSSPEAPAPLKPATPPQLPPPDVRAEDPEPTPTPRPGDADTVVGADGLDHRFALAAQGTVLLGVLPAPALALAPAMEVTLTRIFEVRASALVSTTQTYEVLDPELQSGRVVGTIEMTMAAGRIDACAGIPIGRGKSRARGCGGMLVGSVRTEPISGAATDATATLWAAPALRGEVEIPAVPWFGIGVAADFFVPVVRPDIRVERGSAAADAISNPLPPVGGSLAIGPFLHF